MIINSQIAALLPLIDVDRFLFDFAYYFYFIFSISFINSGLKFIFSSLDVLKFELCSVSIFFGLYAYLWY